MTIVSRTGTARFKPNDVVVFNPSIARAARAFTGLSHSQLGKHAGVASRTVFKLEKDGKITSESLEKIIAALTRHGIAILYDRQDRATGLDFTHGLRF